MKLYIGPQIKLVSTIHKIKMKLIFVFGGGGGGGYQNLFKIINWWPYLKFNFVDTCQFDYSCEKK